MTYNVIFIYSSPVQDPIYKQVLPFLFIISLDSLEHFYRLYWIFMTLTFLNLSLFFKKLSRSLWLCILCQNATKVLLYPFHSITSQGTGYASAPPLMMLILITQFRCCWISLLYKHCFISFLSCNMKRQCKYPALHQKIPPRFISY